jgi:hypothetical protein
MSWPLFQHRVDLQFRLPDPKAIGVPNNSLSNQSMTWFMPAVAVRANGWQFLPAARESCRILTTEVARRVLTTGFYLRNVVVR